MLRNRTGGVTSKQGLMADHGSSSSSQNPISYFFGSPGFKAFSGKRLSDTTEAVMSPTSILDNKSSFPNPFGFGCEPNPPKFPRIFSGNNQKVDPKGVGLALEDNNSSERKMVLFGTQLKVQIPSSSTESPKSPADFGTKTRNPQFQIPINDPPSPPVWTGNLPVTDMEMSEDYTCVILHGDNPKTTHIFDNCIVGSSSFVPPVKSVLPVMSFLSHCFTCKKKLEETKDIYIYKGEMAFCTSECRHHKLLLDGYVKETKK